MTSPTLEKVIPSPEVLQALQGLQNSKSNKQSIFFLRGEPNSGNTTRIPLALSILHGKVPVVSIQPTDAAAAYAYNVARDVMGNNTHLCYIPLSEAFGVQKIRDKFVWYVSARQFLLHSQYIMDNASVVIFDEFHYSSVNHELSAVLLRDRLQQKPPLRVSIYLMSSYIQPSEMVEPLFENIHTIKLGRPDNATLPPIQIHFDSKDRQDVADYTDMVVSTLQHINSADGAVLVIVPERADFSALRDRLRNMRIVYRRKPPQDGVWDFALYLDIANIQDNRAPKEQGRTIIFSSPYYHTHRNIKELCFKHVICPHWLVCDTYSEKYGKELRETTVLSKREIRFLMAHGEQFWISCTKDTYDNPDAWEEPMAPVLLADPVEYYLKAHYLFKDRSPYMSQANRLPLRFFHCGEYVAWFTHRAMFSDLVENNDIPVSRRVSLSARGQSAVEFMLELGLKFNWALFLTNIRTLLQPQGPEDQHDKDLVQELFDLSIPLAIVMSRQECVLRPRSTKSDQTRHIPDAMHFVGQNAQGARRVGDPWCDAKCLSLYLSAELDNKQNLSWLADIPQDLIDLVKRAWSLPHVAEGREGGLRTHSTLFLDHPIDEGLNNYFLVCLYGSVPHNLACIIGSKNGIVKAMDISSGEEVMLSRKSLLDLSVSEVDIPNEKVYVTYNRIERIKLRDDESGPELIISGLSLLYPPRLSEAVFFLTCLPKDHNGSIRPYIACPHAALSSYNTGQRYHVQKPTYQEITNTDNMDQESTRISPDFRRALEKMEYRDVRESYEGTMFTLQMLVSRPLRPGAALAPHHMMKWQEGQHRSDMILYEKDYGHRSRGIDAYITLLRAQIGMGLKLETMFDSDIKQDHCQQLWKLLHHDFGTDSDSDIRVKGHMLYLHSGEKDEDTFPVKPTLNALLLAENAPHLAVSLYFYRQDAALFSPVTQSGLMGATGRLEWEVMDLLRADWISPSDLARFNWDGGCPLNEYFNRKLTYNMSTRSLVLPIFNKPLFITIRFEYKPPITREKTIEDLRQFEVQGHCPDGKGGFMDQKEEYRLFAVANLDTDDVRLYSPDTQFIVETCVSGNPGVHEPAIMDNGVWKVGEKDTAYLLVYRLSITADGGNYIQLKTNIPEFVSPYDHENVHHRFWGCRPTFHMNESGSGYEQDEPASASPRPKLSVGAPVMK